MQGTSFINKLEARVLSDALSDLVNSAHATGDRPTVAAITGYAAQREEIKRCLGAQGRTGTFANTDLRVDTVDGFQGMERDIVLASTVRTNHNREVGFLRDARRANVLLTRARRGLI